VGGGADGDVDMGSTGTLHITTLVGLIDPTFNTDQLGVSAITCPDADSATFSISSCSRQIIGTTMSDRPWVTSEGSHVYIAYHDPRGLDTMPGVTISPGCASFEHRPAPLPGPPVS
jgi:hypothetical protein